MTLIVKAGLMLVLLGLDFTIATFNFGNSIITIIEDNQACFRRVLAGKRVATHWVRRTLICERLEDCQRECGDEKRFPCEGFNYRLDPSGRGQGECELVEVPLSKMDLYSSPHNRDSNLISHTDYDYYERDRSATNCRANPCVDCGANPSYAKPTTFRPPTNYKPSYETDRDRYRPEITAVDKYRPQNHFYETRPDSWDRYGGSNYYASGGDQHYNRPPMPIPDSRPPYGHNSFNIDRYGTEEGGGGSSDHYKPPPHRPLSPPSSGGYIDNPDYGYRPQKPFDSRPPPPPPRPLIPDSDYNRPSPDPGYNRPSLPDSGYNRPSIPDSGYNRPSIPDSGYNRPSIPDSGYIRPSIPDSGYNRPSPDSSYNRPSIPDSGYNRPPIPDSGYNRPSPDSSFNRPPPDSGYNRPSPDSGYIRPQPVEPLPHKPSPDYDRPDPPYRPGSKPDLPPQSGGYGGHHEPLPPQSPPSRPGIGYLDRDPPPSYHRQPIDYHPTNFHQKPSSSFIPYLIGQDNAWGMYGGTYGSSQGSSVSYRPQSNQIDYWGLRNEIKRKDGPHQFNYFELGPAEDNNVYNRYGGPMGYGERERPHPPPPQHGGYSQHGGSGGSSSAMNWGQMWTRRPGSEECSVKTSEGFRLHKGVVRDAFTVHDIRECEKMCYSEDKFRCSVFSFRYSDPSSKNCLLCDRSFSLLDSYADIVPDRNFDIYSMSDDTNICKKPAGRDEQENSNDQCFIRSVDTKRLFDSIVRDSLTVRSIGECEIECIKAKTFTCRSFSFRYGAKVSGTIIDNCQLSDWPVRDMDRDRHLVHDQGFDVFERASYGKGCEIQPFSHDHDDHQNHNPKLCYLGYGSAAKLLATAIKKVVSVSSELECKNECIRYRDTSPFKCLSFSYGSKASTFNCEMSDLDQSQLVVDVHYVQTPTRDFWLFAWNPFDYTCRDKITSISGNRINSDRRMDIFRDSGGQTQLTVTGKQCRVGTKCEKNHIAGFYSCELEGGEVGSWDFCCRDDHPCGFSRDFDYPWCYVGVEKEQWRSCSVSYVPVNSPQGAYSTNSFVATRYPDKKHDIFQSPPRPGGLHSRELSLATSGQKLLPVQYLYGEGPPNSTQINNNVIDCNRERC